MSDSSPNRNEHISERRDFDVSLQGSASEDQVSLEELLENARAENRRLELKRELAELRARNNVLRNSDSPATPAGKTLRPERMRPYKGSSTGEHLRWFREVEIRFLMSPEYFTTDQAKVIYCMQSLEGDPNTQWYGYCQAHRLNVITFEFFKSFLLDLIADPVNRRLLAYEKWEAAKQRQDEKVSNFKAYLEELEAHLPPFAEEHRANIFLAKLRPELKNKILSTDNVPKQREEILAMAIMQETILKSARPSSGGFGSKQSGGSNIDKPLKARVSKPARTQEEVKKRKAEVANNDIKTPGVCWHCQEPGHLRADCPDKDKPAATVAAVSIKNEATPEPPQKRSRKNEQ